MDTVSLNRLKSEDICCFHLLVNRIKTDSVCGSQRRAAFIFGTTGGVLAIGSAAMTHSHSVNGVLAVLSVHVSPGNQK